MSGCDALTVECRICLKMVPYSSMQQLLPCFHLFCKECISMMKKAFPVGKSKKGFTEELTCPSEDCYSLIRSTASDPQTVISFCDNMMCSRKLSQFESTRLAACQHELCTSCLEDAFQKQPPSCIVEKCNQRIIELEDQYICNDCGKGKTDPKAMTLTSCCKCYLCEQCVSNRIKENTLDKETFKCASGKCQQKKKKSGQTEIRCKAKEDCKKIALNGFPSNLECNHEVCIQCLEEMISLCEVTGAAPMCPNEKCQQQYTVESVNALRQLLPLKAEFFARFDLDEPTSDRFLKDEAVTQVDLASEFNFSSRRMTVRLAPEGEDAEEELLTYDKQGNIGDFIREIRRVLKIPPYEKVYGYFIKRDNTEIGVESNEEMILIDAKSVKNCISTLKLTPDCVIRVDTAGIVQQKSSTSISK